LGLVPLPNGTVGTHLDGGSARVCAHTAALCGPRQGSTSTVHEHEPQPTRSCARPLASHGHGRGTEDVLSVDHTHSLGVSHKPSCQPPGGSRALSECGRARLRPLQPCSRHTNGRARAARHPAARAPSAASRAVSPVRGEGTPAGGVGAYARRSERGLSRGAPRLVRARTCARRVAARARGRPPPAPLRERGPRRPLSRAHFTARARASSASRCSARSTTTSCRPSGRLAPP